MGSGYSRQEKKRVCPQDYDVNKFKMILELYDKLDENGDNVVDALELQDIADLHVRNRINNLKKLKTKEKIDLEKEISLVNVEYDKKRTNNSCQYYIMYKSFTSTIY